MQNNIALPKRTSSFENAKPFQHSHFNIIFFFTFAALIAFHSWSLMRFPAPFVDEAWGAARAWNFVDTRQAFSTLDSGVFDRFEGYWTFFPWLPVAIQSIPYHFADEPTLLPLRAISLVFGIILLLSIYHLGKQCTTPYFGLLSMVLVGISIPFIKSSHLARYDIFAASLGWLAVALYFHRKGPPLPAFSFASGFLLGLAYEMHAHGAIYGPTLLVLYLVEFRSSIWKQRTFWGFAGGTTLGLLLYGLLHIFRFPESYFAINQIAFSATHTPPIATGDVALIMRSFWATTQTLHNNSLFSSAIPIGLWLSAQLVITIYVLTNSKPLEQRLVIIALTTIAAHSLLIRNKFDYYAILSSPGILLVGSLAISKIYNKVNGEMLGGVLKVALPLMLATMFGYVISLMAPINYYPAYTKDQARINYYVNPNDKVISSQTFWLGLHKNIYLSWELVVYHMRLYPDSSVAEALSAYRPDLIIIDSDMREYITNIPGTSLYSMHLKIPKDDFETVLQQRGTLVHSFQSGLYGFIEIYKLDWNKEARVKFSGAETSPLQK